MEVFAQHRFRTAAVAIAAIGAMALGACSAPGTSPGEGQTTGGKISVWFPGTDPTEVALVTKKIVPAFEKATGAQVSVTYVDWSNISTKLNAAFAAGTAPDVFGHGPAAVADFVTNKRVQPLTDYIKQLSQEDRSDMSSALQGGQVDGVQYLVPLSMLGNMIMYNAADFTAAGLDPNNPPTTWEGVLAAAKKLTKRDGAGAITRSGLMLPSQPIGRQQTFAALLLSDGGKQLNEDHTAAAFDSNEGVRALDFFTSLFNGPDAVSAGLGANYINTPIAQQPIVLGTASMEFQTPNGMQQIVTANPKLDLRVMMPPKFEGADKGYALGGAGPGLMINADSKQKALAWKFIQYMIAPDTSVEYTKGIGAVPPRASAVNTPYVKNSAILKAFVAAAPQFVPNPNVPGWVQIRDTMDKYLEQALNKKLSSKDALNQAAVAVDKILKANG